MIERLTRFVQLRWFYWFAVFAFRNFARYVYGLKIHDIEKVPMSGGLVVASNHISSLDPPVLGVSVPREIHYMAKKELFVNPWMRMLVLGLRAFPVDRSKSDMNAIKSAIRKLDDGLAVGIFAQGTRNSGDAKALDGAAFIAQRAGVPLLPAAIWREGRTFHVKFGDVLIPKGKSREEASLLTQELMQSIYGMIPDEP